jgi:hypothetical protein
MKKTWGGAAALAVAFAASTFGTAEAFAGTVTFTADLNNYTASGKGGEFGVSKISDWTAPGGLQGSKVGTNVMQTFCLEKNAKLQINTEYTYSLDTAAKTGGVGGAVNGADPISALTAYLYTRFWTGALSNYDYDLGSDRVTSAGQLSEAIWYIEEEVSSLDSTSQAWTWYVEAYRAVNGTNPDGTGSFDKTWSGIGNVRVMNLTDSAGGEIQDQLIMIPIPEAVKLGLGLLAGLGAFGVMRRRRRQLAL